MERNYLRDGKIQVEKMVRTGPMMVTVGDGVENEIRDNSQRMVGHMMRLNLETVILKGSDKPVTAKFMRALLLKDYNARL